MELKVVKDINEFNRFVLNNPYVHYMKTSMWADVKKKQGIRPHFLGFYSETSLIGTALVLEGKKYGHRYFYIPWGPCIAYSDPSLSKEAFSLLVQYAKDNHVVFLRVDPNVVRVSRDIQGNEIEGINNEFVTNYLKELGFIHKGYGYAYDGSWTNRYTLIADISKPIDEIKAAYSKPRITALNRHQVYGVSTRIGSKEDIPYLMEFEKQLTQIQGFKPNSKEYFESILDAYKDHARLYITSINLRQMIQGIENELQSKKYAKDLEAKTAKEKELKETKQLLEKHGEEVVIASGLFLFYGKRSWDLYTYNHKEFGAIKPVDNLHFFAMQDLKANGVIEYDMCGFSGVTSKDDPYYGLYAYKKSFGSTFTEQIGEFDYVVNAKKYKDYLVWNKQIGRVIRHFHIWRYKKK